MLISNVAQGAACLAIALKSKNGEYFDKAGSLTANGLNDTAKNYTYMIGSAWAEMGGRNSADAVLGNWSTTGSPNEAVSNLSEVEKKTPNEKGLQFYDDLFDTCIKRYIMSWWRAHWRQNWHMK